MSETINESDFADADEHINFLKGYLGDANEEIERQKSDIKELVEGLTDAAEHIDNIRVKDVHLTRVEIADKYRAIANKHKVVSNE